MPSASHKKSLGDVPDEALAQLTCILRMRPEDKLARPDQDWAHNQERQLVRHLHPSIKSPSSYGTRLAHEMGRAGVMGFPDVAHLCKTHKSLDRRVVRDLAALVAKECTMRSDLFRSWRRNGLRLVKPVDDWLGRLDEVALNFMDGELFEELFGYQPQGSAMATASSCEACICAAVGGRAQLLGDLKASVDSRSGGSWRQVYDNSDDSDVEEQPVVRGAELGRAVKFWIEYCSQEEQVMIAERASELMVLLRRTKKEIERRAKDRAAAYRNKLTEGHHLGTSVEEDGDQGNNSTDTDTSESHSGEHPRECEERASRGRKPSNRNIPERRSGEYRLDGGSGAARNSNSNNSTNDRRPPNNRGHELRRTGVLSPGRGSPSDTPRPGYTGARSSSVSGPSRIGQAKHNSAVPRSQSSCGSSWRDRYYYKHELDESWETETCSIYTIDGVPNEDNGDVPEIMVTDYDASQGPSPRQSRPRADGRLHHHSPSQPKEDPQKPRCPGPRTFDEMLGPAEKNVAGWHRFWTKLADNWMKTQAEDGQSVQRERKTA